MTDPSNIAATYAERVRRELRHLPVETVADLTDGLESDIASSLADGAALPSADEYAADLLRGAGMEPPEVPGSGVAVRITRVAVRVVGSARRHSRGLAPAWWVLRAWVLMQVLGFFVARYDSPYWFLGQWGGEGGSDGLVGVMVFVVLLVASVRVGRDGWLLAGRQEAIVSAVLAVLGVAVLFAQNSMREGGGWFMYGTPGVTTPTQQCVTGAPYMLNRDVRSVVDELAMDYNIPYRVIDEATGYDLTTSAGLPSIPVLRQSPGAGELICDGELVLYVNTVSGDPTLVITTTVPAATTTSSTVMRQKATTTSTP
jgi:hypothetical protein